jgi:hypothetical protein
MNDFRKEYLKGHIVTLRKDVLNSTDIDASQMQIIILMEHSLRIEDAQESQFMYRSLKEILKELFRLEENL